MAPNRSSIASAAGRPKTGAIQCPGFDWPRLSFISSCKSGNFSVPSPFQASEQDGWLHQDHLSSLATALRFANCTWSVDMRAISVPLPARRVQNPFLRSCVMSSFKPSLAILACVALGCGACADESSHPPLKRLRVDRQVNRSDSRVTREELPQVAPQLNMRQSNRTEGRVAREELPQAVHEPDVLRTNQITARTAPEDLPQAASRPLRRPTSTTRPIARHTNRIASSSTHEKAPLAAPSRSVPPTNRIEARVVREELPQAMPTPTAGATNPVEARIVRQP